MCLWLVQTAGPFCSYSCSPTEDLLSWMGFCGVSLSPWTCVDLTDTHRPEAWGPRLCSGVVVPLAVGLYPATTGWSYRNLWLNHSNWEQALGSTGSWLPALACSGYS